MFPLLKKIHQKTATATHVAAIFLPLFFCLTAVASMYVCWIVFGRVYLKNYQQFIFNGSRENHISPTALRTV